MTDGPRVVRELLVGAHQSINLIREAIQAVHAELEKCPQAEDPLTSPIYRTWDRRVMMQLGAAWGHLRHAQAVGNIQPEVYERLYREIMGIVVRASARVDMLGR